MVQKHSRDSVSLRMCAGVRPNTVAMFRRAACCTIPEYGGIVATASQAILLRMAWWVLPRCLAQLSSAVYFCVFMLCFESSSSS